MARASKPQPAVVDFETEAIQGRPHYPPTPVGVSIQLPGERKPTYYAWGHPEGNNCTLDEAKAALRKAWACPDGILCHNAKFDYEVARVKLGMPELEPEKVHDTMFLLFLHHPHADTFALKPSSERVLGMPPTERDEVMRWLVKAGFVSKQSKKKWGAFISKAPGDLVGAYADGDVIRTKKLFDKLYPEIVKRGMLEPYQREQRLMPILIEIEQAGVPVDLPRLKKDVALYSEHLLEIEAWIRRRLKAPKLNINAGAELVDALIAVDKVDLTKLGRTPKSGEYKTDKDSLDASITDAALNAMLNYRASLSTCLGTFMQPWLKVAEVSGGLIFTNWNQVRQPSERGTVGARTGRLSSSPNFQNIPNEFKALWRHEESDPEKAKKLPVLPKGIRALPLPMCRSYIVPPKGHTLFDRDYSQQELRVLAHYEDGLLLESYLENVWMDVHDTVMHTVNEMLGTAFPRKIIKNVNFGLIYGMGVGLLAQNSGCTVAEARAVKNAVLNIYPGLKELIGDLKLRAQSNKPLRTWGGREYYCEPPKLINDEVRTFDYKMLNVLVQGSAADCTKEAVIRYWAKKPKGHRLLLTVHDEILCSCPHSEVDKGMRVLREAMESVVFDVPILSEGDVSTTNWAELKAYDTKGVRCAE